MILNIDENNFDREVLKNALPVILECWAPWCGPCRMMMTVTQSLSQKLEGRAVLAKLNADNAKTLALKYQIRSLPTILMFHKGKLANVLVGLRSEREIEQAFLSLDTK